MKYQILYADPPWDCRGRPYCTRKDSPKRKGGGASSPIPPYSTMTEQEICALPITEIVDTNAWLFLWTTWQNLLEAINVIPAWGFVYKGCAFVWVKEYRGTLHAFTGLGQNTRQGTEICLLGKRGAVHRVDNSVPQIIHAPLTKHSEKPFKVYQYILRLCGDLSRIELFARKKVSGWSVWGNEVQSDIELIPNKDSKDITAWARRV